jgi:hypothetical protein
MNKFVYLKNEAIPNLDMGWWREISSTEEKMDYFSKRMSDYTLWAYQKPLRYSSVEELKSSVYNPDKILEKFRKSIFSKKNIYVNKVGGYLFLHKDILIKDIIEKEDDEFPLDKIEIINFNG